MKSFNDYLQIIQELRQSGDSGNGDSEDMNDNPWNEVSMDDGVDDVFEYGDLLKDWKDPALKNEWLKMEAKKLKGLGLINYSNAGYDVFTADKGKTFLYRETPDFSGIIKKTISSLTTKLDGLDPDDDEALNETKDELKGYKELQEILEFGGAFGKLIIQKYNQYSNDPDTVPKSRAFWKAADFFGLEID
jgi:hypothetical protein